MALDQAEDVFQKRSFIRGAKGRITAQAVKDYLFERTAMIFGLIVLVLIAWIAIRLFADSSITRSRYGVSFVTTSIWDVPHQVYGALPYLFGTLVSSALALVIAVPLSIGAALFLSEIAPRWLAGPISFVIEFLAAIPSIIFGLWGFIVLCPFLHEHVSPWLVDRLGANPLFGGPAVLTNMLAAGIVLAIMILPIITSISKEILKTIPSGQREASFGLGATKWETLWNVVLPEAKSGISGAVILGLGRAIGETMAVVMVIGNTPKISASILHSGYTMPALLANQFNEAYNDDLQRSALLEIALILFVVTVLVNAAARLLLALTKRQMTSGGRASEPQYLQLFRAGLEKSSRYAFTVLISTLLCIQFFFDFKVHGVGAFLLPVELLTIIVTIGMLLVKKTRGSLVGRRWRRVTNNLMQGVLSLSALLACFMLGALLYYVAVKGFKGLNLSLFTELPRPPGVAGGGIKNSIVGSLELALIAAIVGIPVGLLGGVYVSQFGKNSRLAAVIRFSADVLSGIPSVVIGLFAYAAFVLPFKHFSGWAGGFALAIIMIPIVLRTTEEMIKMVPSSYYEGALALGANRSQAVRSIVLPAARSGIITGIMLAIARVAGETAPLLFTAFGSDQLVLDPSRAMSSLTMKIYQYAVSPYDDWVSQAWAAALVLLFMILVFSGIARLATRRVVS